MKYGDCRGCECLRKNARQFYRCWIAQKNISVLDKCPKILTPENIEAHAAAKNVEEFIATRENNDEKPVEESHGIFEGIKKILGG